MRLATYGIAHEHSPRVRFRPSTTTHSQTAMQPSVDREGIDHIDIRTPDGQMVSQMPVIYETPDTVNAESINAHKDIKITKLFCGIVCASKNSSLIKEIGLT